MGNDNNAPDWVKKYPPEFQFFLAQHGFDDEVDPRMAVFNAQSIELEKLLAGEFDEFWPDLATWQDYRAGRHHELYLANQELVDDHVVRFSASTQGESGAVRVQEDRGGHIGKAI